MQNSDNNELEIKALSKKVNELESELFKYRSEDENNRKYLGLLSTFSFKIFAGKPLTLALTKVLEDLDNNKRPKSENIAELSSSILNRFVRVGLMGFLLVAIPGVISTAAFIWQGNLIERQTEQMVTSNSMDALSRQVAIIDFMGDATLIYKDIISIYKSNPSDAKDSEQFKKAKVKLYRLIPAGLTIQQIPSRIFDTGLAERWREQMEDLDYFLDSDRTQKEIDMLFIKLDEKLALMHQNCLSKRRFFGSFLLEQRPHWE
jgi:hypothetical protein